MTFESETLEPPNADLCTPGEPVGAVELRRAVENGRASFPQLFKAYWLAERHGPHRRWGAEQERDAPVYRQLFCDLLPAFEAAHGPVEMSFYADGMPGAVALDRGGTASDASLAADVHAIVWWEELTFNAHVARTLFSDLMQLRDRVTSFIPCEEGSPPDKAPEERNRLLHEIYCIGCDLIASLECEQTTRDAAQSAAGGGAAHAAPGSETDPSARHLGEVADLRARLAIAEANYQSASKRIGQRWFLPGIRRGGLAAAALLGVFAILSKLVLHWDDVWAATAAAGVAGAVVSVLQRMTSGSLAISAEADPHMVRTIGYCRIALGVGLGVISYVLVGGGLVALRPPSGSTPALYFAGIAFIGGFSERFARDMLAAPTHLLDGLKGTKPAPAPSPAPAAH
jgi:hypothetical protein